MWGKQTPSQKIGKNSNTYNLTITTLRLRKNEWMNLLKVEFELAQHTTKQLELSENLREDWLSQWKILRLLKLVYASNLDQLMNCFTKDIVLG